MKKRLGFIFCMSGILLLIQPSLNLDEIINLFNYLLAHYWPIALVIVGANMMNQKNKPRRNKN